MDNFSAAQYDRFEAYRRHALPKQAVRKVCLFPYRIFYPDSTRCVQVIQQATGQQVSQPVAQIVAGFSKVFVGEIVEKGMSFICWACPLLEFSLSQPAKFKHAEGNQVHCHQTTYVRLTEYTKRKQVV